jgi:hypothetical protein
MFIGREFNWERLVVVQYHYRVPPFVGTSSRQRGTAFPPLTFIMLVVYIAVLAIEEPWS